MTAIPSRVQAIINETAAQHEVDPDDMVGRNSTRAVEIARVECYLRLLAEPKPSGNKPTKAEVARWFGRDHATISMAVKDRSLATELLEDAKL